ncbi:MAG: sugar ABC transporter permease [Chloroflexi bacterium]|nr:sugar ABC transporter permease [Chloroflexota bacterium]
MDSLASSRVPARPREPSSLWRQVWRHRAEYLFISPFFVIFAVFWAYPLGWALALSFQRWSGFGEPRWIGLDNYAAMLREDIFTGALVNTLEFTAILIPTGVLLGLFFAVLLNIRTLVARGVFRTIYFVPFITSSIIIGMVFKMLLDDSYGWINAVLRSVGLEPVSWLRTPLPAKLSVVLLVLWQGTGYNTVIMLGGLQGIAREIYEAAEIDGASPYRIFWRITLPLMRPVLLFVTLVGTIGVLNMFNQPFILTKGGPDAATTTLTFRLYEVGFMTTRYGDAAALGFVIGALVILVAIIQLRVLREWRQ